MFPAGCTERRRSLPLALFLIAVAAVPALAAGPGPKLDFNRDIRPILAENCVACHGPDEPKRKAKLRLDTAEGALAEAASGSAAIVPGKPEESELYLRITAEDPEERMPPAKSGKTLTPEQTERVKAWIEQGPLRASLGVVLPPKRPSVPEVRNAAWCRNPIDAFILARLEKEGLAPSPEADPLTRLRRLSLDLIGLPPTIAEADAALAETGPDADANRVARLLDAPAYGEPLGAGLARRRPLCRLRRLRERQAPTSLVLSRLGHPGPESRPPLRPVHHRADRRRPAAERDARPGGRDRLPSQLDDQRRRGC